MNSFRSSNLFLSCQGTCPVSEVAWFDQTVTYVAGLFVTYVAGTYHEKIGCSLYRKNLIVDSNRGMEVRLVRYPAGAVNPLHSHPCGHGMYVLEGTLVTHDGNYGPGHFVWFPEGSLMEHGATAEQDVTVLFVTNKRFEIYYE